MADALPAAGSEEDFKQIGAEIMGRSDCDTETIDFETRWTSHFQVAPLIVAVVWAMLSEEPMQGGAEPKHLLWAILFLRVYREEGVLSGMCQCVEDTYRKWVWIFVVLIADLEQEVIVWENRKWGDRGRNCLISIDGVDCKTTKQGRSLKAFFSHKFKSSGMRYGVGTSIQHGDIVHLDGPNPPGDWPDLNCFRAYVKPKLDPGERVEADDGYGGDDPGFVVSAGGIRYMEPLPIKRVRQAIRSRHKTINERLKQFHVLSDTFHHDIEKHGDCFRACAVLTQLSFHYNKRPFELEDRLNRAGY